MEHQRFHIRDLDQLRAEICRLELDLAIEEDLSVLADPVRIGNKTAPNRFATQPMEGFDAAADGGPGPYTFRRYERYARGGFGLLWFEATAVLDEARSNPRQAFLHAGNVKAYSKLVEAVRRAAREEFGREPVLVLQLTHSGRYSKPTGKPKPLIAHHSPVLDPQHGLGEDYPLVSDDYLDRLGDTYVNAARLAAEAGFDGVDIKSCHRYLVSELHASFTRDGKYGGPFENRTRLLRETTARIMADVPALFVTTRMNAYDAISYPYGFGVDKDDYRVPDLVEPKELARALRDLGAPVLNVSIGNPYFNPHFGRPFDFPIRGFSPPAEHPLSGLSRFAGISRQMQNAVPDVPLVGSGYSWLRQFMPYVAAATIKTGGAALIGIGRGAFAYPDTPRDIIEHGRMDPAKCCVTCSACTQIMRDGAMTGCVVRDSRIYGPQYRLGRKFASDRLREEAQRCRDCENATCTLGCPAHVNVPAFIKAFAENDIRSAYAILRESNLLPEMCAYVCPSEVQCEGGCLEQIFCENPIPIRDIQMAVCRLAREQGLTAAGFPAKTSGKRVAIVGGGPAGLACAIRLIEKGHNVTVFERGNRLGGTPDTTIPAERFKAADEEIQAVIGPALNARRLDVRFGKELGRNIGLQALNAEYDAVLLAVGLGHSVPLDKAGSETHGVVDALTFLQQAKNGETGIMPERVAVLGGGNTAMDAAVTAIELGARDVYVVYRRSFMEMPAWPAERDRFMAAAGHLLVLTQPVGYETDKNGKLAGVRIARTELGEPDESGRRRPVPVKNSESVLNAGLAIEAIGQGMATELKEALNGLKLTRSGLVEAAAEDSFATSMAGVFAAGDLLNGGTTAVRCVAEGMAAAEEIDRFLNG